MALDKLKIYSPKLAFLQVTRAQHVSKLGNFLKNRKVFKDFKKAEPLLVSMSLFRQLNQKNLLSVR
jgi:hypothetical protein